jgi:small-conductance mechanosensitive channel
MELDLQSRSLDRMQPRALDDLRKAWSGVRSRIEALGTQLRKRSEALSDDQSEMRASTERLREMAGRPQQDLPPPLRERLGAILDQASKVDDELASRLGMILATQHRLDAMNERVVAALQEIDAAQRAARQDLLVPEHPPLWRALRTPPPVENLLRQIRESWTADRTALLRFIETHPRHFVLQGALLILFALATVYLHRRSAIAKDAADDASLQVAALVLSRPLSAALLLALALTRAISPDAPSVVFEINRLVAIVPLLRFLPALVHPAMRRPLFAMAVLYAVDEIRDLTTEDSLLRRIVLLLVSALALAGLVWLVRNENRTRRLGASRWWRASVFGAKVSVVLLLGSCLANLFGAVRLAELLAETTLTGAYIAVALFGLVLLIDAMTTVALRTRAALALNVVRNHAGLIKRQVARITRAAAVALWVYAVLRLSGFTVPVRDALAVALGREWGYGAVRVSLGGVIVFVIAVWAALQISRFLRFVLDEDVLGRLDLPRGVPQAISMLAYYGLLAVGFVVALAGAGIQLSQLTLLISALGVGIGFGLQNIVNNFVSGLILIFERPIKIGDVVEVGTLTGEVQAIGIRASVVRTFSGSDVIVPNGNLISGTVINWTLSDRKRRIEIPVGVAYGTDLRRVQEILREVARKQAETLAVPGPQALFIGFGASSLDFELRFWTVSENWVGLKSAVAVEINDALAEAGIQIPFPQRDLHLRSVDPQAGWTLAPADKKVEKS